MIDWFNVGTNALWITGCALALAVLSWSSWEAAQTGQKWRQVLGAPACQRWITIAGMLFCAGLALTAKTWWEIALWAVLGILFLVQLVLHSG